MLIGVDDLGHPGGIAPARRRCPRRTFDTPANRVKRQAVNRWIRTAGAFDAVSDFDAALRDPADPERLRPAYDFGDGLHPNDAGAAALARVVPPHLFR